nr:MAG TPA: hypothetical protein [Microviridae sp.]
MLLRFRVSRLLAILILLFLRLPVQLRRILLKALSLPLSNATGRSVKMPWLCNLTLRRPLRAVLGRNI